MRQYEADVIPSLVQSLFSFVLCMVMYKNEFKTKESKSLLFF